MDSSTAKHIVTTTLKAAFDRTRYRDFINEITHGFNEDKAQAMQVPDAFARHIKSCQRLGTYETPEGELADILVVHLTDTKKLERARSALRDFVAHKLKRADSYKEAALVAYVAPNAATWRFSYVRMEYENKRDPATGKIKPEERLTPARRLSFLVGADEQCHTAQKRFLPLLQAASKPTLEDMQKAFSIEVVTKDFFEQYRALFDEISPALQKLAASDRAVGNEFRAKNINTVDFSKKLLGQIVFLYFLQKKGWLGVEKDGDWGAGPHDFLRRLARGEHGSYKNFFNDILEPLFYDTLATDRGHDAWCARFKCRIPFLNGGLFEPPGDYDWRKIDILLPNDFFTNTKRDPRTGDTGTGILDVFDRHNFTVNEAEPLEKDVAIDPEMLGKVFENLIEENRRKGLGSFYTPREIVHYMCQESLINYLDTALNTAQESLGGARPRQATLFANAEPEQADLKTDVRRELVPKADIETLIRLGSQISHYESVDARYTVTMPKSIEKHARLIDEKLAAITVCDPAVGSGAFPVGMMTEIVRARAALTPYFNDPNDRTPYHFKRHAIQHCLYGVDIDPGAVEIAKLRLWLSLVVDEEEVEQIKPLPNLLYKIITGNSLLNVEKELFNQELFQRIEELKPLFFDEPDKDKKDYYRRQIEEVIHKLASGKMTFDYEIYFSEVLRRKGGFDIIVANPPYVGESGNKELFRKTKNGALGKFYLGKMDYFYFFFHLALNLARNRAEIAFITTNYYLTAMGARELRADFRQRGMLRRFINFNELRIFESALGQHNIITMLRKSAGDDPVQTCITNRTGIANPQILNSITLWNDEYTQYYKVAQAELYDGGENYIRLNREQSIDGGIKETINTVLDKIAAQCETLGKIANINQGVVSGCDQVSERNEEKLPANTDAIHGDGIFVLNLDNPRDENVISSFSERERTLLRHFYKNSDISRFVCRAKTSKRLLYIGRGQDDLRAYPRVMAHLYKFQSILSERREVENDVIKFFQLQWPRTESIFIGPKIVVPYRSEENAFAYNETEWFCRSDCYIITQKYPNYALGYLLALLNSKLYYQWLFHRGKRKGKMLELFQIPLSEIPIKEISQEEQKPFISLVDRILAAKQSNPAADTSALEREIDHLVYALYDLTPEEIAIVEGRQG